jgi:LPS sulfotransferase NodH
LVRHLAALYEGVARAVGTGLCRNRSKSRSSGLRPGNNTFQAKEAKKGSSEDERKVLTDYRGKLTPGSRAITVRRDNGFMITGPARSGSTMLVHLLRSHPDICSHDEVFSPDKVKGITGTYLQKIEADPGFLDQLTADRFCDPVKFLYNKVLDPQGKKIVGFKLKHDELVLPGYRTVRDEIVSNRKMRIIHLKRNNLLRRYLSHYIAANITRVTLAVGEQPIPELCPVRLDPVDCERNFEIVLAREAEFGALFASHPHFYISYEDIVSGHISTLNSLVDFLGVSRRALTTPTKKLGRDDLRGVIANYDELREYFAGSRFAKFFDSP